MLALNSHNTTPRKNQRFEVRVPITVSGIDRDGHYFNTSAETINGSTEGMGLLLDRELYPNTLLVVSLPREKGVLQLQTEVRYVTSFNSSQKLIGVRIRKKAYV